MTTAGRRASETAEDRSHRLAVLAAYGMMLLCGLFWAGSSVAGRAASGSIPPGTLAFIRWFIAFLLFLPFGWLAMRRQAGTLLRHWKLVAILAFFGIVGFTIPYYAGLQYTTAVNASLLNGAGPVMILLLSVWMYDDGVGRVQLVGVLSAMFGIIIIVLRGRLTALFDLQLNIGDLMLLCSHLSWGYYTVIIKRAPAGLDRLGFLTAITGASALMLLPFFLYEYASGLRFEQSAGNWTLILYVAIFPSAVAYVLWNRGVEIVGPNRVTLAQYMIPVFGVILSVLTLGEKVEPFHLAGVAAIFVGVYLVTRNTAAETRKR